MTPSPLDMLRRGVESYEPYLQPDGEMIDPVFGVPTQYGTAYHAFCQAVLAEKNEGAERDARLERAERGLDAALRHVADPELPPTVSGVRREHGSVSASNHRDFFWPPILKAHRLLTRLGHPRADEFAQRIRAVDIEASFRSRPPSNWSMVWLTGEWLRMRAGLSRISLERFDGWLAAFFDNYVLVEQGLYQEPGHPNSYDLFTRVHMAELLAEGYDGRWRSTLERLMETGLVRSLAVQLSDGSLASAHRSTGQTWTVGAQCAYFTLAANHFAARAPERARQAKAAAALALASLSRWQRPDGPFSPVENVLPPAYRVGYEGYTCDGHYGNLALGFLATAILHGLEKPAAPGSITRPPSVYIEGDPTYRALAHAERYSVHVNAHPAPDYDGFGIVDLTFGPGRRLQFASSARHLSERRFYNMGLALRRGPGRSELQILAQAFPTLIGPITAGEGPASLRLSARIKGDPYTYALAVDVSPSGVEIEERTPSRSGFKTLLIPYLRQDGSGRTTEVAFERAHSLSRIRLRLGEEVIRCDLHAEVEALLDLPYGYENRRGLVGLLRLDIAAPCEAVRYHWSVEA
ncbi:MAG TPA: hypothetical protein VF234_00015 [Limnochordia bacterium]